MGQSLAGLVLGGLSFCCFFPYPSAKTISFLYFSVETKQKKTLERDNVTTCLEMKIQNTSHSIESLLSSCLIIDDGPLGFVELTSRGQL